MKNPKHNLHINFMIALIALTLLSGATMMADPTRPPDELLPATKNGKVTGGPRLTAIFVSPKGNYALIDGNPVFIGDALGAYTITNIRHDAVELRGAQNERLVIELLPIIKETHHVNKGR